MVIRSMFGVATLQVATAVMSTVFLVVGVLVLGVNVFTYETDPENDWPICLVLSLIFVVLMLISGTLLFMSAYTGSRTLCYVTMLSITLTAVYWAVLTVFSFLSNPTDVRRVCISNRCGESFWLAELRYRSHPDLFGKGLLHMQDLPKTVPLHRRDQIKLIAFLEQSNTTSVKRTDDRSSKSFHIQSSSVRNKRLSNTNLLIVPSTRDKEIKSAPKYDGDEIILSNLRTFVESPRRKRDEGSEETEERDEEEYYEDEEKSRTIKPEVDKDSYQTRTEFAGAIVFAIFNIFFFFISMVVILCYSQELKWVNPKEESYQMYNYEVHN